MRALARPFRIASAPVVAALAVAIGIALAISRAWLCDDAFISFRYARNLVAGLGLVYNAGERVEGYSNLLWTLWCAAGLRLGFAAQLWSQVWGLALYAGSLLLLWVHHRDCRRRHPRQALPVSIALILGAAHADWTRYATSGLETSAVTFLSLLAYVRATQASPRVTRRHFEVGILCALAALARPDAVLLLPLMALYILVRRPRRAGPLAGLAAGFAICAVPVLLWKLSYYGQLLPNTYYAKSASLSWWSQGGHYVGLYLRQYWVLLAGLVLLPLAALRPRRACGAAPPPRTPASAPSQSPLPHGPDHARPLPESLLPESLLAAGFVLLHTLYVARLGGDFMYARMLIPTVPFCLILIEHGLMRCSPRSPLARICVAAALLAALILPRAPLAGGERSRGISDEWSYYQSAPLQRSYAHRAPILRRYFAGLPVRVAFFGTEARLMDEARVPFAYEAETGLVDPEVARQPLSRRGRVGHEKPASLDYLISSRRVHFTFHSAAPEKLDLEAAIPVVKIGLDGVGGWVLRWDREVMRELQTRGAVVEDFIGGLDRIIAGLDGLSDDQVARLYRMLKLFYFDHTDDIERESHFLARRRGPAGSDPP